MPKALVFSKAIVDFLCDFSKLFHRCKLILEPTMENEKNLSLVDMKVMLLKLFLPCRSFMLITFSLKGRKVEGSLT